MDFTILGFLGGFSADTFTHTYVSSSAEARFIQITVAPSYIDERHDWSFTAVITGLNTAPLVFDPLDEGFPLVASETDPEILVSTGFLAIYHMDADVGIGSGSAPIRIDQANRRAYLPAGDYVIYDVNEVAPGIPFTVYANLVTGEEAFLSFDDAVLTRANYSFPLFHDHPTLGGYLAVRQEMHIDDRGVVFGFTVDLPDRIGLDVDATFRPRSDGAMTHDGRIIGRPAWAVDDVNDVVLLDSFRADLRDITMHWLAGSETWQWRGEVVVLDLLGAESRIALHTTPSGGFFAHAGDSGLDGALVSAGRSRLAIGEAGSSYDLILDDIVYLPQLDAPGIAVLDATLGFKLGRQFVHLDASLSIDVDTAGFTGTGATFAYQAVEALSYPPIETGFAGVTITYLDASITGLADIATAALTMDAFFDIGQGDTGPLLTLAATLAPTGARGLSGAGLLVHQSALLEIVAGLDITFDSAFGTFAGAGAFNLSFDILGAALDARVDGSFRQYEGTDRSLEMRGNGVVSAMPEWLAALYGVTEAFDVEMTASINPFLPSLSFLDLSDVTGDFGLRYWFDGRLELLDGVGLGDADFDGGGGLPGLFSFTLDLPSDRLVLRAEGEVDADDVVLVDPGGARLALADFAARGMEILADDAGGLTLLVNAAEAGTWQLEAPDATGFSGFAALPPLTLAVTAITTEDGPGLRAVADWAVGAPEGGYIFRLFADDDASGFDGAAVLLATAGADGVFEVSFADLGLAPGEHFFHVQVTAAGLSSAGAYLADPVTIAGVADLTIGGDYFWVQPPIPEEIPEGESPPEPFPMLGITVTNEGTARAIAPTISFAGTSIPPMPIEDLAPGETRHLLLDLSGGGVSLATLFITLDITHGGFEADLADNSVTLHATALGTPGPKSDAATVMEDEAVEIVVLANDSDSETVTLGEGPRHGSVELLYGTNVIYTPDADFFGTDVFTYAAGGGEARVWITVTPANDAPVLVAPIADVTVVVAQPLDIVPGANAFDDVDGIAFTYDLAKEGSDPLPDWIRFDAETGRITGTPAAPDLGTLTLVLTAFDPAGESASDSFTLTIQAPGGGTAGPDNLSGSNLADAILALGGDDTVNGRNGADTIEGGEGRDRLLGAGGNDLLAGGGEVDALTGAAGNDTLAGGAARDRLIGGDGADQFRFAEYGSADLDVIADFTPGEDVIAVSAASFGGELIAGVLGAAQFRTGLNARATSESGTGQFVYETDAGKLWWDADGTGGAAAQIVARFAPIPGAALGAGDILVIA